MISLKYSSKLLHFKVARSRLCCQVFYLTTERETMLKIESSPPEVIHNDWIGPPDSVSNLRPFKFRIPNNETHAEKHLRLMREENQKWNQEFWAKHNRNYFKEKEHFIEMKLKELGKKNADGSSKHLTSEQLSVFYKQFLNDNYKLHVGYNSEWYKRQVYMVMASLRVAVERIFKKS